LNKTIIFILGLVVTSVLAGEVDKRQTIVLTEAQRDHVLGEMRALLMGTKNILAALSKNDMAAVAQYASLLGMSMVYKAEDHLKDVLPEEFMQLGMSVHKDFDLIAADAKSLKNSNHTLQQLSESMNKCVECHAAYQIRITKQPAKLEAQSSHHSH
jgi:hypothetical protein